ncbi:hypothetical protein C8R46DRAFT_827390, partial [Mycena filopes]
CINACPQHRCLDCLPGPFLCASCMHASHQQTPLHRIEWWDGFEFTRTHLKNLGVRIQLGHPFGRKCPHIKEEQDFQIIDADDVHPVSLDYCGCPSAPSRRDQLLAHRLYPQNLENPRFAVTFQL